MEYILGIDIGTTGTKSALFDINGRFIDLEYRSYSLSYPRTGWVEQNPEDWWEAILKTVRVLVSRNNCGKSIISLSLSTQGGSLILLDSDYKPIYSAVSWMDTRASEVEENFIKNISKEKLYKSCGWPITNGLNLPTIFWFKRKRPNLFKKASYFASTIDFINYRLTGKFVIDYSNLALTEFLDLNKKNYYEEALLVVGLKKENMPLIIPSGMKIGYIKRNIAEQLGISKNAVVISGAHDQYSAGIGSGAVEDGDCTLSAGTAWVLLTVISKLFFTHDSTKSQGIVGSLNPGIHPIDDKYGLMTSVPFGGNALNWYRDTIRNGGYFEEFDDEAASVNKGSDGLIFVPLMTSKSGKGAFIGIDASHSIKHFTRAVFEGVVFTNKKHFDLVEDVGIKIKKLIMIGGGTKSKVWPQIVADVCNVPIIIPKIKEAACAGAVILAGVGVGVFNSIVEASKRVVKIEKVIEVQHKSIGLYNELYKKYVETQKCLS